MAKTFDWAGRTFGSGPALAMMRSYSVESLDRPERVYGDYRGERAPRPPAYRISLELDATGPWLERFLAFMEGRPAESPAGEERMLPAAEKALPPGPIEGEFIDEDEP